MSQRVQRLVSAGVPLTDAFRAVMEEIIDNGPADLDTLTKCVEDVLRYKETRILNVAWPTWSDFTQDVVDQISGVDDDAKPTLMLVQGKYSALEFTHGAEYVAIDKPRITYTVWDEETRLKRDLDARMQMDLVRVKGDIQTLYDRYPGAEIRDQLKRTINEFSSLVRSLNGVTPAPEPEYEQEPQPLNPKMSRKGVRPRRHGVSQSVEGYAREFPEFWFTRDTIVDYWNQRHPDEPPLDPRTDTGAIRRELSVLTGRVLERRGGPREFQYRLAPHQYR